MAAAPTRHNALVPPESEPVRPSEARNALIPASWSPADTPEFRLAVDYGVLVLLKGKKEARRILKEITERKRGREKGSTKPEHDIELLRFYNLMAADPGLQESIESLPRVIGQHVHNQCPGEYGSTAQAITARLRRLLKQRSKQREEAATHPGSLRNMLDRDGQNK
jgi:hypothetical protein